MKLTNDEIKCISMFESLTGAHATDCIVKPEQFVFVVAEGQMGRAIGKGGQTIKNARDKFGKNVEVFEAAANLEGFVKNLFQGLRVKNLKMNERDGKKTAVVTIEEQDRGAAIGRGGEKIKLMRELLERHFDTDLRLV